VYFWFTLLLLLGISGDVISVTCRDRIDFVLNFG
jgi:hypothetical protein